MKKWLLFSTGVVGFYLFYDSIKRLSRNEIGLTAIAGDSPNAPQNVNSFKLISPSFEYGQFIPAVHSGEFDDKSPTLLIEGAPTETQSFALIMEDPDSPMPPIFDHWLVWNIPGDTTFIPQGNIPYEAVQGKNTLNNNFYNGPCPPSGVHHYHFKLFALDTILNLPKGSSKPALEAAMKGHILAKTELVGLYQATPTTQGNLLVATLSAASAI